MGVYLQGRLFGPRLDDPTLGSLTHSQFTKDNPRNERAGMSQGY